MNQIAVPCIVKAFYKMRKAAIVEASLLFKSNKKQQKQNTSFLLLQTKSETENKNCN